VIRGIVYNLNETAAMLLFVGGVNALIAAMENRQVG